MTEAFRHVVCAALLHDIGKVMQRAGVELAEATRQLAEAAGPTRDGRPSHHHVHWTSQFFDSVLPATLRLSAQGLPFPNQAAQLAFHHHNPSTPLQFLIAEADRQASGMERGVQRDERMRASRVPLQSLLSRLRLPGAGTPSPAYLHPAGLSPEEESFVPVPADRWGADRDLTADYQTIWGRFVESLRAVGPDEDSLEALDGLMERYFTRIPASTIDDVADTSLYDHSHAVAVIAAARYLYHAGAGSLDRGEAIRDRSLPAYRLVVGDLSGIQDYIFDIAHGGAGGVAKALRARSLTVGLTLETVARQLLRRFGLPDVCQLLASGGKFYLLLPNLDDAVPRLQRFEGEVAAECLRKFNGEVGVSMASVALTGADLSEGRLIERVDDLMSRLNAAKSRPLVNGLHREGGWDEAAFVLSDWTVTGEDTLCPSCRKFPARKRREFDGILCDNCFEDRQLGRNLANAQWLEIGEIDGGWHEFLGWRIGAGDGPSPRRMNDGVVWALDETLSLARLRRVARHVPLFDGTFCPRCEGVGRCAEGETQEGQPRFFRCIANAAHGKPVLGVLKGDVDSLGLIIQRGLPDRSESPDGWNLSRFATFSRQLDGFFSGRLEALVRNGYPLVYTVYSGGDDFLLVGPWDMVLDLALRIRREFDAYVGGNPSLTLSCGIALAGPREPIHRIVERAEIHLEEAKKGGNGSKDRCATLNQNLAWSTFVKAMDSGRRLAEWQRAGTTSTAFVRNLLYYATLHRAYREDGEVVGLRFLPLLCYDIDRNLPPPERGSPEQAALRQWAESLRDLENPELEYLEFVARYSLTRNQGGHHE